MNPSIVIFAVILIFSDAFAYEQEEKYDVSDLRPFLEKFRTVMRTGNESLRIPVLDPEQVEDEVYHLAVSYVNADLNLRNLYLTGLSDYQVKEGKLHLAGLHLNLAFYWEKVYLRSDYSINGVANQNPLYGNGQLSATIRGLDLSANVRLSLRNSKLYIASVTTKVNLGSLDANINGLYNDEKRSEEVSRMLSQRGHEIVQKYPEQVAVVMNEVSKRKLDLVIDGRTTKELLDMLDH